MTQEKLTDKAIDDASQAANDVILALAGEHEEVSLCDNKKMVELWDDLNDRYAPPALVRAMALELQKYRHDEKAFNGAVTAQTAEAIKLSGEDLKALQGRVEGELKPFMYGIADPDGAAHFGEFCVSSDAAHVEDEVHQLNEDCTEDGEPLYKVVPLYRLPELEK